MSAKEALLNAIFRGNIPDLDLDSSEVDGHFRILWSDDAEFWSQFWKTNNRVRAGNFPV